MTRDALTRQLFTISHLAGSSLDYLKFWRYFSQALYVEQMSALWFYMLGEDPAFNELRKSQGGVL